MAFDEFLDAQEERLFGTEKIFFGVDDWHDDDGHALFFKLDAGEPPAVTSPLCSSWDSDYYTHWMPLPNEFKTGYRIACIKSGIKTDFK